ncbi:unnamed protein product [Meganyctiphanes norvegica]|uniref:Uncharacterized protein n=1 Tax=Meganyctiphanes norvegica TaxID=48144 RepID=A0AAV2PRT8_MEGNR
MNIIAIICATVMQDGPFFLLRMTLIFGYQVVSYTNIFFTCKNTLMVSLQIYRLFILCSRKHRTWKKRKTFIRIRRSSIDSKQTDSVTYEERADNGEYASGSNGEETNMVQSLMEIVGQIEEKNLLNDLGDIDNLDEITLLTKLVESDINIDSIISPISMYNSTNNLATNSISHANSGFNSNGLPSFAEDSNIDSADGTPPVVSNTSQGPSGDTSQMQSVDSGSPVPSVHYAAAPPPNRLWALARKGLAKKKTLSNPALSNRNRKLNKQDFSRSSGDDSGKEGHQRCQKSIIAQKISQDSEFSLSTNYFENPKELINEDTVASRRDNEHTIEEQYNYSKPMSRKSHKKKSVSVSNVLEYENGPKTKYIEGYNHLKSTNTLPNKGIARIPHLNNPVERESPFDLLQYGSNDYVNSGSCSDAESELQRTSRYGEYWFGNQPNLGHGESVPTSLHLNQRVTGDIENIEHHLTRKDTQKPYHSQDLHNLGSLQIHDLQDASSNGTNSIQSVHLLSTKSHPFRKDDSPFTPITLRNSNSNIMVNGHKRANKNYSLVSNDDQLPSRARDTTKSSLLYDRGRDIHINRGFLQRQESVHSSSRNVMACNSESDNDGVESVV